MVERGFIPAGRIAVIGNGIDTRRFRRDPDRTGWERRLGLRSGRFRIATVGRLVQAKGFVDLLGAFARMRESAPEAELLLIGGNIDQDISPVQSEFFDRAQQLGVAGDVTVTGMVHEVEKYLSTCDVFALPSHREGMPRALLEAMSSELPVIATAIRGCREIIDDGRSGLLYPPGDVDRLTGMLKLLHGQSGLRLVLGQMGRAAVVQRFDEYRYVRSPVEHDRPVARRPTADRQRGRRDCGLSGRKIRGDRTAWCWNSAACAERRFEKLHPREPSGRADSADV